MTRFANWKMDFIEEALKTLEVVDRLKAILSFLAVELSCAEGFALSVLLMDVLPEEIWLLPFVVDMICAGVFVAVLHALCAWAKEERKKLEVMKK